jgi:hypothetical protein
VSGRGAHQYRAVFADVNGRPVDELHLSSLQWDRRVQPGGAGTLRASIDVPTSRTVAGRALIRRIERIFETGLNPQSPHAVHLWRDGGLAWSGLIAAPVVTPAGIQLQGISWEGYPAFRTIRAQRDYVNVDQYAIADALWAHMQSLPGGSVRVAGSGQTSGTVRERHWAAGEGKKYSAALDETAGVSGGFEWLIDYGQDGGGLYSGRLRYGMPLGQQQSPHKLVYLWGGAGSSILDWSWPSTLDGAGTSFQSIGGQDPDLAANQAGNVPPIMSAVYDSPLIANGWPRIDYTSQHTDVTEQPTIEAWAQAEKAQREGWLTIPKVTIDLDKTTFRGGSIGDAVQISIRHPFLTADYTSRGLALAVAVDREGAENAKLTLDTSTGA